MKYNKKVKKISVDKLNIKNEACALDLCCGTGDISYFLSNKERVKSVIGLDFSEKMLEILKSEYLDNDSDTIVEEFTKDDYIEFTKRLSEYPFLKERAESLLKDMEYYRKSMTSKERQMELLLLAITSKRFIEEPINEADNNYQSTS